MIPPLPRESTERLDWARAAGLLDLQTGDFAELHSTDRMELLLPKERREALRGMLVSGGADSVARLLRPADRAAVEGPAPFREILIHDRSGFLFGKVLRDGRSVLLVATDPTESPGRLWAQIKVLILALGP